MNASSTLLRIFNFARGCDCNQEDCVWIRSKEEEASPPSRLPVRVRFDGRKSGAFEAAVNGHLRPTPRKRSDPGKIFASSVFLVIAAVGIARLMLRNEDADSWFGQIFTRLPGLGNFLTA